MPISAIEIHTLSFAYEGQSTILQIPQLQVLRGERVGIVGCNGVGKTTLFHLLCGLLQPVQGSIAVFENPVISGAFSPDVGFVFQNPEDQLFSPSVWEEVAFGPGNMGLSNEEIGQRVHRALAFTGTESLLHLPPHHLSGGQKRMVAIASVLALEPRLMIYDEPSANLDLRARRRLIQLLLASGETMLVSSHDLELIREVCDRVLVLDQGQVVADGATVAILADRGLMEHHGLEVPASLEQEAQKLDSQGLGIQGLDVQSLGVPELPVPFPYLQ
ncbi:MAG: energy-coupling factor ABC transporter ATP-binding protein [Prochlorothrix sp.]|nr:ABC transporter ATP-binding protein [Prochlorothrix sp.]